MLEQILQGATSFVQPVSLLFVGVGVLVGTAVGLVPGLNGLTTLALMIPFVYGADPAIGLSFLLAIHAVVNTASAVPAILIGIPGEPASAATVIDGHKLAQQGRGGEAIGAALAASGIGGVFGALVLLALLPVLAPIVLYFKSPDTLMIALFGISLIGVLAKGSMAKGLLAGALGMLLATVGYQDTSGVPRFWFEMDFLLDGFALVPVTLGLFAVPEILSMGATGRTIADEKAPPVNARQVFFGAAQAFKHWVAVLRSSLIGVCTGVVPGLGGATAPWLAYMSAAETSREKHKFGQGSVEGVIAPEASNNSKEGGSLIPTLAFGIPGSSSMALLIGAFYLFGLTPGPEFLEKNMPTAVHMTITVAVANIGAAVLTILVGAQLSAVTRVPGRILAPILMLTLLLGTYATSNEPMDLVVLMVFGIMGLAMKELNYSRPCFLIGFVLAPMIETYLHISLRAHGWSFLLRPVSLLVFLALAVIMARNVSQRRKVAFQ